MESMHTAYSLLPVSCLALQLYQACNICCLCTLSPSMTSNSRLSSSYTGRCFLGWFFFMAVWCTNTPSLVSFLLIKPHPFLISNHFTVPKTFVAIILSLLAGVQDVRPPGPPLPVPLPMVPAWCRQHWEQGQQVAAGSQPRCSRLPWWWLGLARQLRLLLGCDGN